MSDEMAIGEKTSNNDQIPDSEGTIGDSNDSLEVPHATPEAPVESCRQDLDSEFFEEETSDSVTNKIREKLEEMENDQIDVKMESIDEDDVDERGVKRRASAAFSDDGDEEFKGFGQDESSFIPDYNRIVENVEGGVRRKSTSSDTNEEFKGFESSDHKNLSAYNQTLERLEAELSEAVKGFTPLKTVMAVPSAVRASKRPRHDTEGSRPSSALSSRSEGEGALSTDASSSPAGRGRRPTTEMSSPLLRVPLERGWRRELVYRAALDAHSRRAADIYYYTPAGKKLRSMREVSEVLSGTGLSTENFSFFKEPLGIDDPEKEIIRDAKLMRRVESPVPAVHTAVVEGKRTPKPKPPKGASPEPATPKSPPGKIKVKSMGSRLSNSTTPTPKPVRKPLPPAPPAQSPAQPPAQAAPHPPTPDNNNTPQAAAPWKKPRGAPPPLQPRPAPPPPPPQAPQRALDPAPVAAVTAPAQVTHAQPTQTAPHYRLGAVQQPCSMACGRGAVPSLACSACLCLYHPACVGATHHHHREDFLCKNCRKSTSPPMEPAPLTHKSGATAGAGVAPARRMPVPVPVPVPAKVPRVEKRPVPRMKASGTGAPWAAAAGPQSLAVFNGRRFIVVARPANT